jgi:hypothetical protein
MKSITKADGAREAVTDARRQALEAAREARKQARRQVVHARITAARTRGKMTTKLHQTGRATSAKAVGAAGAAGLAAGYFLDPESGSRRRHQARDRALALVRRGAGPKKPAASDQEPVHTS